MTTGVHVVAGPPVFEGSSCYPTPRTLRGTYELALAFCWPEGVA
jgi:hypothetical protein